MIRNILRKKRHFKENTNSIRKRLFAKNPYTENTIQYIPNNCPRNSFFCSDVNEFKSSELKGHGVDSFHSTHFCLNSAQTFQEKILHK